VKNVTDYVRLRAALRPFADMMRVYNELDKHGDVEDDMNFFEWLSAGVYKTPSEITRMFDDALEVYAVAQPQGQADNAELTSARVCSKEYDAGGALARLRSMTDEEFNLMFGQSDDEGETG